jgi:hypothetical protein
LATEVRIKDAAADTTYGQEKGPAPFSFPDPFSFTRFPANIRMLEKVIYNDFYAADERRAIQATYVWCKQSKP